MENAGTVIGKQALEKRVVSGKIGSRVRLVGREPELMALRSGFTSGGRPAVQVLTGMGGVGKTSIARAYAQRHEQSYDLIWWVAADDPGAVDGQFRRLMERLAPDEKQVDAVGSAHAVLAARPGLWLLVVDNLDDPQLLKRVAPVSGNGHVLVTTRAAGWSGHEAVLTIKPLSRLRAVELLTSLSNDPDHETAAKLASLVGDLPLALAQAGALCGDGMSLSKYLKLYQDQPARLRSTGAAPDYPATVGSTFQLSFARLSAEARALLKLLSFLAPDAVPLDMLFEAPDMASADLGPELRPLLADEVVFHRAKGQLVRYSLVTITEIAGPLSMHRLVQDVVHDQLFHSPEDKQPWINAARAMLDHASPVLPINAENIRRWLALQPHVLIVIDHLQQEDPETLRLREKLARWTGQAGNARAARDLYASMVPLFERVLGGGKKETLIAQGNWAHWTGEAGDAERARDMYAELASRCVETLGEKHPDTLIALSNLARWTGAGDAIKARDLAKQVLDVRAEVLGSKHPDTLLARSNFAHWTAQAGDNTTARDLFAALVRVCNDELGAEHNSTLVARANLARLTGNPETAREQYKEVVRVRRRLLGDEQRDTLRARNWLAHWTGVAGDRVAARDLFAELVPLYERVFGPDHVSTKYVRDSLARWTERA